MKKTQNSTPMNSSVKGCEWTSHSQAYTWLIFARVVHLCTGIVIDRKNDGFTYKKSETGKRTHLRTWTYRQP
jgi:hypothetical protein